MATDFDIKTYVFLKSFFSPQDINTNDLSILSCVLTQKNLPPCSSLYFLVIFSLSDVVDTEFQFVVLLTFSTFWNVTWSKLLLSYDFHLYLSKFTNEHLQNIKKRTVY